MAAPVHRGQLLSPERSLQVGFWWHPGDVWWGATWACLCGAVAALPWAPLDGVARFAIAWFSAVVLLGAVWAPALAAGRSRGPSAAPELGAARSPGPSATTAASRVLEHPFVRSLGAWAPALVGWIARRSSAWRVPRAATLQRTVAGIAALTVASLLGVGPAAVVAVGLAMALTLPGALWHATAGIRRTALEIVVPAATAWLAMGGPEPVPASASVFGGTGDSAAWWWSANWGFLAVLAAFAAVYHASTSVQRPADLPSRHRELVLGYGACVLALAALDRPLAAGVVAALFIAQWPFEAEFRAGRVRWHLNATQPVAMAAMMVAALGAG